MKTFFSGLWLVAGLELKQRVRGVAWYILLGIFVLLVAIVTVLLWVVSGGDYLGQAGSGGWLYSIIVYFVLLLGTLVTPALSGNAINGDRDAGTLATTQVTLVTTWQLVLGKFLAAWMSSLAFLVATLPFVAASVALGNVSVAAMVSSALVLAVELGVLAAIGVGLSAIVTRPLFSIVLSYLVVAALSVGTLIAFGILGSVTTSQSTITYIGVESEPGFGSSDDTVEIHCLPPDVTHRPVPRFDRYWGILAANPYLVVADAAPGSFDENGAASNLFTLISVGVQNVQHAPDLDKTYDECARAKEGYSAVPRMPSQRELYESRVPSWYVGLGLHLLLAAGALIWGWGRTRTPARRLPRGSRVA